MAESDDEKLFKILYSGVGVDVPVDAFGFEGNDVKKFSMGISTNPFL